VHTGEFGNEGSGGQSYLKYNWKAGNTYKFLLHGIPQNNNSTNYTAYFYAPELKKWLLIASFNRPETHTYLKRFHSFLENFIPEQGDLSRKVLFNNQWICDDKGVWTEINSARFTTDNTGAKEYRMDYAGGLDKDSFYLKNGGFFNNNTKPKTIFTRPLNNKKPEINFKNLP
ncbi:nematoblast specific protein, partial [Flavobacterium sp. HMWF030]